MPVPDDYEVVVGLEVHAQLMTRSKLFCGDSTAYGTGANIQVSPFTLAHPGTLPVMNRKAVEFAVKIGLACNCEIEKENYFARKNYFYPDLPKGYQVSQHSTPICKGGFVIISVEGKERTIRLNRIHLEEDAGKSLHDVDEDNTCIDYNRAGTPLVEIVTEPDLRSGAEAFSFVTEIRKLVRYLGICDGNMEEGSLRCDANISVRKKGDPRLGTRVEVKNLNSIRHVKKAIELEAERLKALLENDEPIIQQTRSFDPGGGGTTFAIRDKEEADDYRYFPEPDLTPFRLQDDFIQSVRAGITVLPAERIKKYRHDLQLSAYDAELLTEEKEFSDYFEQLVGLTTYYKSAANWMLGPVRSWLNQENKHIGEFSLPPAMLAKLVVLVEEGKISFSQASSKLFTYLLENSDMEPAQAASDLDLLQESGISYLEPVVDEVLLKFAEKVKEYKKGKKGLLALFVGEVMKRTGGKADPAMTNELLIKKINVK